MAVFTGVFRLGNDPKTVEGRNGNFLSLNMAYDAYDPREKKNVSQWVNGNYFGQRAEKMAKYLKKGSPVEATITDLRLATFDTRDGETRTVLEGNIVRLNFISGQRQQDGDDEQPRSQRASRSTPATSAPVQQPASATALDPLEDPDIPF